MKKKICGKCKQNLNIENFVKCTKCLDGLHTECKRCQRIYKLKHRFNITIEEYNKILKLQKNLCACCKKPNPTKTRLLNVDHDHKTGKVRGLLCHLCNRGIGCLGDDLQGVEKAFLYLKKFYSN